MRTQQKIYRYVADQLFQIQNRIVAGELRLLDSDSCNRQRYNLVTIKDKVDELAALVNIPTN